MKHISIVSSLGVEHRLLFKNPDLPRETLKKVFEQSGQHVEGQSAQGSAAKKERANELHKKEEEDRKRENPDHDTFFTSLLEETQDPEAAAAELQAHTRQAVTDFHESMQALARRDGISQLSFSNAIYHYLMYHLPRDLQDPVGNALCRPPGRFEYRANGQVVATIIFTRGIAGGREYRIQMSTQPSLGQFRDHLRGSLTMNSDLTRANHQNHVVEDCQAYWRTAPVAVRREIIRASPIPIVSNQQRFMLEVGQNNAEQNDAQFTIRRSAPVPT